MRRESDSPSVGRRAHPYSHFKEGEVPGCTSPRSIDDINAISPPHGPRCSIAQTGTSTHSRGASPCQCPRTAQDQRGSNGEAIHATTITHESLGPKRKSVVPIWVPIFPHHLPTMHLAAMSATGGIVISPTRPELSPSTRGVDSIVHVFWAGLGARRAHHLGRRIDYIEHRSMPVTRYRTRRGVPWCASSFVAQVPKNEGDIIAVLF